ncbi:MAG: acyltransferase [Eubacterium sp.]|nr:acyltransferase [Eubacterium sp.]
MTAETIEALRSLNGYEDNQIIGLPEEMESSVIEFNGKGNILFFDKGVKLYNSRITFNGGRSIVFICSSGEYKTRLKVDTFYDNVFYIGRNCNTTRAIMAVLSERRHIVIGDNCLFSLGTWFRNADPHLIYSTETKKRLNPTKSIYVGDHVWMGQNVLVSKGTHIGSGSIIAAKAFTAGKRIPSNCTAGGVPAKIIGKGIFWHPDSVHSYKYAKTQESQICDTDEFIFEQDGKQVDLNTIEQGINAIKDVNERFDFIRKSLYENTDKNRFFIPEPVALKKPWYRILLHNLKMLFIKEI